MEHEEHVKQGRQRPVHSKHFPQLVGLTRECSQRESILHDELSQR
jgi:hypothetical protein